MLSLDDLLNDSPNPPQASHWLTCSGTEEKGHERDDDDDDDDDINPAPAPALPFLALLCHDLQPPPTLLTGLLATGARAGAGAGRDIQKQQEMRAGQGSFLPPMHQITKSPNEPVHQSNPLER
ncbi:hypothetical protein CGRA01v4_10598 [Colletotrichum graminicola]|nr:hypothetical protein CGRA01v4_10598 [Colletotrichum graminicola]